MKAALDRNLPENWGRDYIDIMLLHGMSRAQLDDGDEAGDGRAFEAKEKKIIRTLGAFHPFARRDEAGRQGALVLVHLQASIMPGIRMDSTNVAEVVAVLRESKANGKGILGMKILGEGRLRDQINKTLSFVLGLDCLDAFTIGAANRDETGQT